MTTKHKNKGVGDGSGRWLMEEFLLEGGRYGKFVVEYSPVWIDMKNEPEWPTRWMFQAAHPAVFRNHSDVYDDNGDPIPLLIAELVEIEQQVLEAFQDDIESVEIYERERR